MTTEHKRQCVIDLHNAGKSNPEILKLLKHLKLNKMFVSRTIKRFAETNSTKDRPRSGCPRSATGPEIKKKVAARIRRNPERSMRKMAAEVGIGQ